MPDFPDFIVKSIAERRQGERVVSVKPAPSSAMRITVGGIRAGKTAALLMKRETTAGIWIAPRPSDVLPVAYEGNRRSKRAERRRRKRS